MKTQAQITAVEDELAEIIRRLDHVSAQVDTIKVCVPILEAIDLLIIAKEKVRNMP